MNLKRIVVFPFLIALSFVLNFTGISSAIEKPKDYPKRPIEMVVGAGPGGGSDVFTRTICIPARKYIREVPIVVVNKPGGSQAVGVNYVQNQPADGYTIYSGAIVICTTGNLTGLVESTYTDWRPIMRAQYDVTTIAVKGEGGKYNTIQDLIEDAKSRPGKVTLGAAGRASFWEMVLGQFAEPLGLKFKVVAYNSAGKIYAAVLGGHIDGMLEEPATIMQLMRAKKIKMLLTFTENRLKGFSDIPCTKEFGTDAYISVFRGMCAKKGTPEPIIQYLHSVFKKAYDSDFYQSYQKFSYMDLRPGYLNPDDTYRFMKQQYEIQYRLYKKFGLLSDKVRIKID